jgi:colicin import membrane protein
MLTISLQQKSVMKCIRIAIIIIAACALFTWARAQKGTEKTVSNATLASAPTALSQRAIEDQERARIVQEKASIAAQYDASKADCYQKFQVNSCLADARSVRISRNTAVKRQEVLLNDAQRKRRADEQLQRTQEKALASGEDAVPVQPGAAPMTQTSPDRASTTQSASAQAQRQQRTEQKATDQQTAVQAAQARKNAVANKQANAASKAAARTVMQVQAAEAKARYEANLKEAEQRRANAVVRQQAAKKNVAPLPVPAD